MKSICNCIKLTAREFVFSLLPFLLLMYKLDAMCSTNADVMPTNFAIARTKNKTKQMHFAPMNAMQIKHNKLWADTC